MSVYNYKKYKVSLNADTKKTQGLRPGDVVRRQYFDGKGVVYSLMCVLESGVDTADDNKEQPFFVGALLEGNIPQTTELLDFVRVTSLFDMNRSGALYLTASDSESPYLDVVDGIGRNRSLCWPEGIGDTENADSTTQYIVQGREAVSVNYIRSEEYRQRICHLTCNTNSFDGQIGLQQDFYEYVANPDRVLISYQIKASRELTLRGSLGYVDGSRTDGEFETSVSAGWQYKLHVVTVDWSGRHLRRFRLDINDSLQAGDEVFISDLNIILLSNLSNFKESSQIRIGKMTGINDAVFGQLEGYGGYLQRLYASRSAHISGTLTAGDEAGFGATFYAGRIHRNAFVNSLDVNFTSGVTVDGHISNPTGTGLVYVSDGEITAIAQTPEWLREKRGKKYCFSFWLYAKSACSLSILQNGHPAGTIAVDYPQAHRWNRYHVVFELMDAVEDGDSLYLSLVPVFAEPEGSDETLFYFTAPQFEAGDYVSQYQPTDNTLNYTNEYGAWLSKGGIGGTIQNPLLQLNYDNEGGIGTRTKSFLLRPDGSRYLANRNIRWDEDGEVTFGEHVSLNWDNLEESVRNELVSKSIRITGSDTFVLLGDLTSQPSYSPSYIELLLLEENIESTANQRQWSYLNGNEYIPFPNSYEKVLTILPDGSYWGTDNTLTVKCTVTIPPKTYADTITIKKLCITGYTVEVDSARGHIFKNGACETILTAQVYYQGKLVSPDFVSKSFTFLWEKYHLPDREHAVEGWWNAITDEQGNVIQEAIDRTRPVVVLRQPMTGSDLYVCKLQDGGMFPYSFPVIF